MVLVVGSLGGGCRTVGVSEFIIGDRNSDKPLLVTMPERSATMRSAFGGCHAVLRHDQVRNVAFLSTAKALPQVTPPSAPSGRERTRSLAASVGSTEAAKDVVARFGVGGPKRATRLSVHRRGRKPQRRRDSVRQFSSALSAPTSTSARRRSDRAGERAGARIGRWGAASVDPA
jgi:hypothetical protein